MKRLSFVSIAIFLFCITIPSIMADIPAYSIIDLGTPSARSYASFAYDINNHGQVVGYAVYQGGISRAFLYSNGLMQDLGTLGGTSSNAYAINDKGQVTGRSQLEGNSTWHGFLYSNEMLTDIGGGNWSHSYGINNAGQIVGGAYFTGTTTQSFLYSDGQIQSLEIGNLWSYARDINNNSQIAGYYLNTSGLVVHSYLYSNGITQDIGTLGGNNTYANALNDHGQVVGSSYIKSDNIWHAFLYSDGTMYSLGTLNGTSSYAQDINNLGQVVGYYSNGAFLYENGTMTDLYSLLPIDSGWRKLEVAYGINDLGQIVGYGFKSDGSQRAFLMTPIPEPAALSLLAFGGLALLRKRK